MENDFFAPLRLCGESMRFSKSWIRVGCVGGGLLLVAVAAWSQQERLRSLWEARESVALPSAPVAPSEAVEAPGTDRYQPIHRRFGPPAGSDRPAAAERPPFSIAEGGFCRIGGDVAVMMRNSTGRSRIYRAGDEVLPDGGKVLSIDFDRKTVRAFWSGREWTLERDRAVARDPATAPVTTPATVDPPVVHEISPEKHFDYLSHMDRYFRQADYDWPREGGLVIRRLDADAEARKYGIEEGDRIVSVNGTSLKLTNAFQFLGEAKTKNEFEVKLERGGKTRAIRFKLQRNQ